LAEAMEKDDFYEKPNRVYNKIKGCVIKIIVGDYNSNIGVTTDGLVKQIY
jgi:hypothetical protein